MYPMHSPIPGHKGDHLFPTYEFFLSFVSHEFVLTNWYDTLCLSITKVLRKSHFHRQTFCRWPLFLSYLTLLLLRIFPTSIFEREVSLLADGVVLACQRNISHSPQTFPLINFISAPDSHQPLHLFLSVSLQSH